MDARTKREKQTQRTCRDGTPASRAGARRRRKLLALETLAVVIAVVACMYRLIGAAPVPTDVPSGAAFAPMASSDPYIQVDGSSKFFDEGSYINQLKNRQDPPFTTADFEVEGGHMVKLARSQDEDKFQNAYTTCNIWPYLVGQEEGIEGWGFVADGLFEEAEGARVSMTYNEVGTLENAADPSDEPGPLVDIKVTYTIVSVPPEGKVGAGGMHEGFEYDGHPVIQFTDNFSYGVFQIGIEAMDVTFEFIDHETGEKLNIDNLYYTNTSQDKGEGVAIEADRIVSSAASPGVWLSNDAPILASDSRIHPETRYDAVPGSLVYEGGHCEAAEGKVSFTGVPIVFNASQTPGLIEPDGSVNFVDTIGDSTYYWRSTCYLLDLSEGSAVTVTKLACGYGDWTEDFDIPDPSGWGNGAMAYSTHNFLPLTNPSPKAPHKTINGGTDLVEDVHLDDTVDFTVTQRVHDLGADGFAVYRGMIMTDKLSSHLTYEDGSLAVTDTEGETVDAGNYTVSFDKGTNTLTVTMDEAYLTDELSYNGGDFTFSFSARVVDQPADDTETVENKATVQINELPQDTNIVEYDPAKPVLSAEKHAVLDDKLASAINEYEYLSHDENDEFSTVTYQGFVTNIADDTRAKVIEISDDLAPGLILVEDSLAFTGADPVDVETSPDGWRAVFDILDAQDEISFTYQTHTSDEGNGLEVVNTVVAACHNAEETTPGSLDTPATDDSEVYINDPNLVLTKTVAESPIQNDDYTSGEEYRVDDEFTYTVTLVNDRPGTFAKAVRLVDEDLPAGFELVGNIEVSGLDIAGTSVKIPYPISGTSDAIHGEEETRDVSWDIANVQKSDGTWGWRVDISYLDYNRPITVTWRVKATQAMNGYEVFNRAYATAENQPDDTFASTDTRTGSDYTLVWINTPEFDIEKTVRSSNGTYQVGDAASYDVVLHDLKTPGTLARQTVLTDEFISSGTTIVENSFVITSREEEPADIANWVDLNRSVGDQSWNISMAQAFQDTTGYWICAEGSRPIFKDGVQGTIEDSSNPVGVVGRTGDLGGPKPKGESSRELQGGTYFKVHYEATINDHALENELITNVAEATSAENFPVEDDAQVTVVGANLDISKDSTDDGSFEAGEVATYTVEVSNPISNTTAKNIAISDSFTTHKAGTAAIIEETLALTDKKGNRMEVDPETVTFNRNEAGLAHGFTIETDLELAGGSKIILTYDVKYLSNNGGECIVNTADAWADNAPRVTASHETWPEDMDQSILRVDKGSDRQQYEEGDVATYTHHIVNSSDITALNVMVHDAITLDTIAGAAVVKGSVEMRDHAGDAISLDRITYLYTDSGQCRGFEVETGHDLATDESIDVSYQVRFEDVAQATQVVNDVWTASDNTGRATDTHEVEVEPAGGERPDPEDPNQETPDSDDPDPADYEDEDPVPDESPKLTLAKRADVDYVQAGGIVSYTLEATASGGLETVTISDELPAGMTLLEDSIKLFWDDEEMGTDEVDLIASTDSFTAVVNLKEEDATLRIAYRAQASDTLNGGDRLENIALATSDDTEPAEATSTVEVPLEETDTPGKDLGKTGDPFAAVPAALTLTAAALMATGALILWRTRNKRR